MKAGWMKYVSSIVMIRTSRVVKEGLPCSQVIWRGGASMHVHDSSGAVDAEKVEKRLLGWRCDT